MRNIIHLNRGWLFRKGDAAPETVDLPHTWNAQDGADGGNDYYRGVCTYEKAVGKIACREDEEVWLEIGAASAVCTVFWNGSLLGEHKGGYSAFRFPVTDLLCGENLLSVKVDNSPRRDVYPQRADFTFYGGLYRGVDLIVLPKAHFDLSCHGGKGIAITPAVNGDVQVACFLQNAEGERVTCEIYDREGRSVSAGSAPVSDGKANFSLHIDRVHLWQGVKDPYLYTLKAAVGGDEITERFGVRSFAVDPARGFLLNGEPYDLIGCARHQDRAGVGCALTGEMMREDMRILREMGATTVRLAHYQHHPYFYDLADECGVVVWAEIPYISEHMPEAVENVRSQMEELILQNYNHPSIAFWGLSNEITVVGGASEDCIAAHRALNDLCHRLDPTRLTAMANLFLLETDSPLVRVPDVRSYNLYYGWYVGEMEENDRWFDRFHAEHPDLAIGLSEFGADANPQYQTASPVKGDYSESYQALYHEHMMAMRMSRPWIYAMHVWNLFDFAADGRDEGGKKGVNQKGLVSFDRKIKKDAFYLYKAYLSEEKFVHLCGSRYIDRPEEVTEIKVYSNLDRVSLYLDGELFETKDGSRVFRFSVPISGEHTVRAVSGEYSDEIRIRRVTAPNPAYACETKAEVANWFDDAPKIDERFFSIRDRVKDIKAHPVAGAVYGRMMQEAMKRIGDVAKSVQIPKEMQERMDNMTLEENLRMAGHMVKPEMIRALNETLQKIKK